MTDLYEIEQLVKLFNPPKENDSDSDECDQPPNASHPEDKLAERKVNPYEKVEPVKQEKHTCETEDSLSENEPSDWKKTPKWDISYRQQVTASDVFLQMGAKTPATASCEDMIVTIDLPGEHMQNIDIKVQPTELVVHSPNFSVKIPLPQPVQPQRGDAKWDKDRETLTITLKMEREFDFINF